MRRLLLALLAATLAGCASVDPVPAVTREDVIELARSGADARWIIDRLRETGTFLAVSAGDIIEMHKQGVPQEALEWMQATYVEEVRRRQAMFDQMYYGPCTWRRGYWHHPRFGPRLTPWPGC